MEEAYSPEIIEAMEKAQNSAWDADRKLRAAAPELAEALKAMIPEYIQSMKDGCLEIGGSYVPEVDEILQKALKSLRLAGIE